jgi:hypothetical protein
VRHAQALPGIVHAISPEQSLSVQQPPEATQLDPQSLVPEGQLHVPPGAEQMRPPAQSALVQHEDDAMQFAPHARVPAAHPHVPRPSHTCPPVHVRTQPPPVHASQFDASQSEVVMHCATHVCVEEPQIGLGAAQSEFARHATH